MTFTLKAPKVMSALLSDFPIGVEDAAAILGNLGHESGGFEKMQEISPTVAGSRGGYGWAQWTGPRRREFEAYCQRNRLDPASDRANYAFLFLELKGSERKAIPAVVAASGLEAKVKAFELAFERAGVKHYPSRVQWAKRALTAWQEASAAERVPDFLPAPATIPEAHEPIIVPDAAPIPTPAPIGHNGGPALEPEPRPANPSPTPVEQSSKAIGAGVWAALAGAIWTAVIAADVLPPQFTTPAFTAAVTALLAAAGGVIGAYRAPANAVPPGAR